MNSIKYFLTWALFMTLCFDTLGQDTLNKSSNKFISKDGKMIYHGGNAFRQELLRNSEDLGKRTNNIELLSQVNLVKIKRKSARKSAITSMVLGVAAVSIYSASFSQSLNSEDGLKVFFIGSAFVPPSLIFGLTAMITNGQKKRATRKLATLYNAALN